VNVRWLEAPDEIARIKKNKTSNDTSYYYRWFYYASLVYCCKIMFVVATSEDAKCSECKSE